MSYTISDFYAVVDRVVVPYGCNACNASQSTRANHPASGLHCITTLHEGDCPVLSLVKGDLRDPGDWITEEIVMDETRVVVQPVPLFVTGGDGRVGKVIGWRPIGYGRHVPIILDLTSGRHHSPDAALAVFHSTYRAAWSAGSPTPWPT